MKALLVTACIAGATLYFSQSSEVSESRLWLDDLGEAEQLSARTGKPLLAVFR